MSGPNAPPSVQESESETPLTRRDCKGKFLKVRMFQQTPAVVASSGIRSSPLIDRIAAVARTTVTAACLLTTVHIAVNGNEVAVVQFRSMLIVMHSFEAYKLHPF